MTTAVVLERLVLDALPGSVCAVDLEGRITFANRQWMRSAHGANAPLVEDVVGSPVWGVIAGVASREQIERAFALLREGRAQSLAWETSRGTVEQDRSFLMQVSAIHDGHSVVGFVFSSVDTTPSLRWRDRLIDASTALAPAVSADRVFQELARQLRKSFGCEAVAIAIADETRDTARLAYQVGFESDPAELEGAMAAVWHDAISTHRPNVRELSTGAEVTVPMLGDGVRGAITIVSRPTDAPSWRDEIQRALTAIASQVALAITRSSHVRRVAEKSRFDAIGEVAAGVARELRNPLFGISSAGQLLRYRVREDPVIEKNVGRVLREVERLNVLATSLLEYGRPDPLRLAPADPDHIWESVLEAQRGLLESKALVLSHTPAHPRVTCNVDSAQLAQVFVNVLTNATEAAPEGTDLSLNSTKLPGGAWRCQLHNEGPAIPPDILPHVFEMFVSTKPGSTGLGLALCQRVVDEHAGKIDLESTADAGTTLTIVLPPTSG
jgi:signal transduction histidine kinase